jgi:SOS-response transcriptional repressor LexA
MDMTIGDRFKYVRDALGLKQAELARKLQINPSLISDIERGDKEPSKRVLTALILTYRVNANWILTEQGDVFIKEHISLKSPLEKEIEQIVEKQTAPIESRLSALERRFEGGVDSTYGSPADDPAPLYVAEPKPEYGAEPEERARIPYVEDVAAGPPIPQSEYTGLSIQVPRERVRGNKGDYYAAGVRGESMTGAGIPDGSVVLIRRSDTPRNGAIQVAAWQGRSTLKRLREKEGGGWELRFEDGTNRAIAVETGECRVQGDFVAVLPPDCKIG